MTEPEIVDLIIEGLELGLPVSVSLETAGVRKRSFQSWMLRGKRDELKGMHGDDDTCDKCVIQDDDGCRRDSPYQHGQRWHKKWL